MRHPLRRRSPPSPLPPVRLWDPRPLRHSPSQAPESVRPAHAAAPVAPAGCRAVTRARQPALAPADLRGRPCASARDGQTALPSFACSPCSRSPGRASSPWAPRLLGAAWPRARCCFPREQPRWTPEVCFFWKVLPPPDLGALSFPWRSVGV